MQPNFQQPSVPLHSSPNPAGTQLFQDFGGINVDLTNSPLSQITTQIGFDYGNKLIGKSYNQYNKNFHLLKYYFNVNNSYVTNKIKLLLFPFKNKYWKRRIQDDEYLPPRDDINAPDLYIPTMSFATYILLLGFVMGSAYRFTPEVLGKTATSGLIVLGIEVFAIKFGLYLLNAFTVSFLDLISYCGYKYVGIVLTILGGFIFGRYGYYSLMLVTSLFMAIFMVRTLKHVFPEGSDASRNYFLLGVAGLQLVFGYYLSYDVTTI